MKKIIGGLFQTQENANHAYEALQKSGFTSEQVHTFIPKPRESTLHKTEVSVQDIAVNAILGGMIVAAFGGLIGFLVGIGILPLPGLEPGVVNTNGSFILTSILWGLVAGGLTGIILGVATKLFRSRENAEVVTRQIQKRGVLLTVNVDDSQSEKRVRRVMEENEAQEVGDPAEKWDLEAWLGADETNPSLKNLANTR